MLAVSVMKMLVHKELVLPALLFPSGGMCHGLQWCGTVVYVYVWDHLYLEDHVL